jgi:hypothetical protein
MPSRPSMRDPSRRDPRGAPKLASTWSSRPGRRTPCDCDPAGELQAIVTRTHASSTRRPAPSLPALSLPLQESSVGGVVRRRFCRYRSSAGEPRTALPVGAGDRRGPCSARKGREPRAAAPSRTGDHRSRARAPPLPTTGGSSLACARTSPFPSTGRSSPRPCEEVDLVAWSGFGEVVKETLRASGDQREKM